MSARAGTWPVNTNDAPGERMPPGARRRRPALRARVATGAAVLAALVPTASCRSILPTAEGTSAMAELRDAAGRLVGRAQLDEVSGGVRIVIEMSGLSPGPRAVHIHAAGRCEPPAFLSAGPHYDPAGKRHGLLNPDGPHVGDLPNITIEADGSGRFETTANRITLGPGPTSVFDDDGSSLVIHAGPDDFQTDPDGASGPRIACGVIVRTAPTS